MMRLKAELQKCNCPADPDTFRDVVESTFNRMYPDWTDDQLLCQPVKALEFDNEVRAAVKCAAVPDEVINRTLINLRKSNQSRHQRKAA